MTDEFGIAGKTLLVTGSGRNLGKAIVLSSPPAARTSSSTPGPTRPRRGRRPRRSRRSAARRSWCSATRPRNRPSASSRPAPRRRSARSTSTSATPPGGCTRTSGKHRRGLAPLPQPAADRVLVPGQGVRARHARTRLGADPAHERADGWSGGPTRLPHSTAKGACGHSPSRSPAASARTGHGQRHQPRVRRHHPRYGDPPGAHPRASDQIAGRRIHPHRPPAVASEGRLGVRVRRGRAVGRHQRHRDARRRRPVGDRLTWRPTSTPTSGARSRSSASATPPQGELPGRSPEDNAVAALRPRSRRRARPAPSWTG